MTDNNFKVDSAAVTDRGLSEKRPQNEDAYLEMGEIGLYAVADGVGGAQAGDVASQMAVEILAEAFSNLEPNEDAEDMMKIALERANGAIFQMSRDLPQLATMATTIVALHLAGNIATIGHVGDSRLYLLDPAGDLYRKTDDHSVVEEEVRAGRMTIAQAAIHPSRNIISRALGADIAVDVELKTIMFEPNTTFLLCSDGITRHLTDFELRECLVSDDSPAEICEKMRSTCYQRGAEDNLTAVIARISDVVTQSRFGAAAVTPSLAEETTAVTARTADVEMEPGNILDLGDGVETRELESSVVHNLPPIELEVAEEDAVAVDATPESPTVETEAKTQDLPSAYFDDQFGAANKLPVPENPAVDPDLSGIPDGEFSETAKSYYEEPIEDARAAVEDPGWIMPTSVDEDDEPQGTFGKVAIDEKLETFPAPKSSGEKIFDLTEPKDAGLLSKIMSGIFIFLIGAIIGAGALYVYTDSKTPENVEIPLPAKTENIGITDFEESRRGVDDDPEKYIRQYQSLPNKDVEDLFLLGRAQMLVGNYTDARDSLTEARKRLGEANENNDTVIADDIAAYLAIIANSGAQKTFSEELKKLGGADGNTLQSNSNSPKVENKAP